MKGKTFFFLIYGCFLYVVNLVFLFENIAFPVNEINVFGIAVAILLGFRNNEVYNRFWETRTAWEDLMNASRKFVSQVTGYVRPPQGIENGVQEARSIHSELIFRHLAFLNALRLQLRKEEIWEELKPFLPNSEFEALGKAANKATQLNHRQSLRLSELHTSGWIQEPAYVFALMESIKEFFAAQGCCERIKNTPLP